MRKLLIVVLALALSFALAGSALAFTDLADCSAETRQAINELAEKQILNGYIDETFRPDDSINRAEFAKVAVLAYTAKTNAPLGAIQRIDFSDVPDTAWYVKDVANAAALGLMKGDSEGTFRPNDTVSTAEVITVLVRCLGYTEADLEGIPWPANYLAKAGELGIRDTATYPSYVCTRGDAATYVARMLALPMKGQAAELPKPEETSKSEETQKAAEITYAYGVVTAVSDKNISISSFDGEARSYKLAADCTWAAKSESGVGRLVYFGLNAENAVVSVTRESVYTHNQHEAELDGSQIKLNGKKLLLDGDAQVLLMNSGGGVVQVGLDRLMASSYVADLRSNDYRAPLQYVSADGKSVDCLLIGDYRGQSDLQFGFLEEYGTSNDGLQVKFYGDPSFYEWHYDGKGEEQGPQVDVLYAYEFRANSAYAYPVGRTDEEIRGNYGEGEIVQFAGDICLTEGGKQFIVKPETVIMKVTLRDDNSIAKVEYIDTVYGGDRVCVRYTHRTGSNYTAIDAAYILVIETI